MRPAIWLRAAALCTTIGLSATAGLSAAWAQAPAAKGQLFENTAAAYADYQGEVSNIRSTPLGSAQQLDKALDTFGAQNADQLSSGWISYTAMIASQEKDFAVAVRDIDSYYGRDRVMTGMRNDVGYARTLKGGEQALQTALMANSQDTTRISSAASFVKEQAFKLQGVPWGKTKLADSKGTAEKLKVSAKATKPITDAAKKIFSVPDVTSLMATQGAPASQGSLWDKVSVFTASAPAAALGVAPSAPAPAALKVDPKREATANRMVTLAAFRVLDAESTNGEDVKAAMRDQPTYNCIDWSQLQLQACVSAAYTRADLSFCLAEHAIRDPGACFSGVAR